MYKSVVKLTFLTQAINASHWKCDLGTTQFMLRLRLCNEVLTRMTPFSVWNYYCRFQNRNMQEITCYLFNAHDNVILRYLPFKGHWEILLFLRLIISKIPKIFQQATPKILLNTYVFNDAQHGVRKITIHSSNVNWICESITLICVDQTFDCVDNNVLLGKQKYYAVCDIPLQFFVATLLLTKKQIISPQTFVGTKLYSTDNEKAEK